MAELTHAEIRAAVQDVMKTYSQDIIRSVEQALSRHTDGNFAELKSRFSDVIGMLRTVEGPTEHIGEVTKRLASIEQTHGQLLSHMSTPSRADQQIDQAMQMLTQLHSRIQVIESMLQEMQRGQQNIQETEGQIEDEV